MGRNKQGYNDRLFSGGLRRWVHLARFRWLTEAFRRHGHTPRRVVELGCFDAKTLDYLPSAPEFYHGLDANWDGGLDMARSRWSGAPSIRLSDCSSPDHLPADVPPFDTVISMETIEHLPPAELDQYLDRLAALADGLIFITVPNEIGAVFAAKWLTKALLYRNTYRYRAGEWWAAVFGRTERIDRHHHKGFDYRRLIESLRERFEILEVTPMPVARLPVCLGVTIGIVARARRSAHLPFEQPQPSRPQAA